MSSLPNAEVSTVASVDEFLSSRYATTLDKASSLYGKVLLGIRGDGQKEICKISDKRRSDTSKLLEDPFMEVHVMRELQGCEGHVQLIEAVQDDCFLLIVIEYVDGGDLYDYMCNLRPKALDKEQATDYVRQLCRALISMHDLGFCHLDISLENILLDADTNQIKICDYGLARRFTSSRRFGNNSIRSGKRGYIAPEIASRQPFDGELGDVWAVAVVFWILLTGHPPFGQALRLDPHFAILFNSDCAHVLRRCRLSHYVPEKERALINRVFVDAEKRIRLRELYRLLDDESDVHSESSDDEI